MRQGCRFTVMGAVTLATLFGALSVPLAATCRSYTTCREAVTEWCAGRHPRADGDDDGIPCENVCGSRQEVLAIEREIGCDR